MRIDVFILTLALALGACSNSEFAGSGATSGARNKPKKQEKQAAKDGSDPEDGGKNGTNGKGDEDGKGGDDAPNGGLGDSGLAGTNGGGIDEGSAVEGGDDLGEEDDEIVKEISLPLEFQAFPGDAADTNCIFVQINGQPEVEMGCNIGANKFAAKTLKAKSKPFCNVIRMIDKDITSGAVITTQNANQIRWGADQPIVHFLGMRVFEPQAGTIKGEINDNADANPKVDVSFQISGLGAIDFTIENSGRGCTP